jgi:hypothetical protein
VRSLAAVDYVRVAVCGEDGVVAALSIALVRAAGGIVEARVDAVVALTAVDRGAVDLPVDAEGLVLDYPGLFKMALS